MGSLRTPPGQFARSLTLITAQFSEVDVAVAAPDADLDVRNILI